MKRIDIIYDGVAYSVGNRELEDVKAEIAAAIVSGKPGWLHVNQGGGIPRATDLLITAATHIALIPIAEPPLDEQL